MPTELLTGDFDGDNKTDIVMACGNSNDTPVRYIFYPYISSYEDDGSGCFIEGAETDTNKSWAEGDVPTKLLTGNFNGDFLYGWGNNSYDANIRQLVFGGASTSYGGLLIPNDEGKFVLNTITESY